MYLNRISSRIEELFSKVAMGATVTPSTPGGSSPGSSGSSGSSGSKPVDFTDKDAQLYGMTVKQLDKLLETSSGRVLLELRKVITRAVRGRAPIVQLITGDYSQGSELVKALNKLVSFGGEYDDRLVESAFSIRNTVGTLVNEIKGLKYVPDVEVSEDDPRLWVISIDTPFTGAELKSLFNIEEKDFTYKITEKDIARPYQFFLRKTPVADDVSRKNAFEVLFKFYATIRNMKLKAALDPEIKDYQVVDFLGDRGILGDIRWLGKDRHDLTEKIRNKIYTEGGETKVTGDIQVTTAQFNTAYRQLVDFYRYVDSSYPAGTRMRITFDAKELEKIAEKTSGISKEEIKVFKDTIYKKLIKLGLDDTEKRAFFELFLNPDSIRSLKRPAKYIEQAQTGIRFYDISDEVKDTEVYVEKLKSYLKNAESDEKVKAAFKHDQEIAEKLFPEIGETEGAEAETFKEAQRAFITAIDLVRSLDHTLSNPKERDKQLLTTFRNEYNGHYKSLLEIYDVYINEKKKLAKAIQEVSSPRGADIDRIQEVISKAVTNTWKKNKNNDLSGIQKYLEERIKGSTMVDVSYLRDFILSDNNLFSGSETTKYDTDSEGKSIEIEKRPYNTDELYDELKKAFDILEDESKSLTIGHLKVTHSETPEQIDGEAQDQKKLFNIQREMTFLNRDIIEISESKRIRKLINGRMRKILTPENTYLLEQKKARLKTLSEESDKLEKTRKTHVISIMAPEINWYEYSKLEKKRKEKAEGKGEQDEATYREEDFYITYKNPMDDVSRHDPKRFEKGKKLIDEQISKENNKLGLYYKLTEKNTSGDVVSYDIHSKFNDVIKDIDDYFDRIEESVKLFSKQTDSIGIEKFIDKYRAFESEFKGACNFSSAKVVWDSGGLAAGYRDYDGEGVSKKVQGIDPDIKEDGPEDQHGYEYLWQEDLWKNPTEVADWFRRSLFFKWLSEKLKSIQEGNKEHIEGIPFKDLIYVFKKFMTISFALSEIKPTNIMSKFVSDMIKKADIGTSFLKQEESTRRKEEKKKLKEQQKAPEKSVEKEAAKFTPRSISRKVDPHSSYYGQKYVKPGKKKSILNFFEDPDGVDEFINALKHYDYDFLEAVTSPEIEKDPDRLARYNVDKKYGRAPKLQKAIAKAILKKETYLDDYIKNSGNMVDDIESRIKYN
jgi:hypothetical protein